MLLIPILTGALTKEDFGAYSLILMGSVFASGVFYLGMTSALPRFYFDYESSEDRKAVFTTAFVILLLGAILQSLLGCVFSDQISIMLVGNTKYHYAVCYAMMGGGVSFINSYFFCFLRLQKKSIASVLLGIISLVVVIMLTLFFLSTNISDVSAAFRAVFYSQILVSLIFLLLYAKSAFTWKLNFIEFPNLIKYGIYVVIGNMGSLMLFETVDRIMIRQYLGLATVGVYSASIRLSLLINVVFVVPFLQIWSPMMMELRNKENIKELFSTVFSVFMIFGGLIILMSALLAVEILSFGIRSNIETDAVFVFIIYMLGFLIFSASNFLSAGLLYEKKVHVLALVYYLAVPAKLVISAVAINMFGLEGAAISAFLTFCTLTFSIYYFSKKYFDFRIDWRRLLLLSCIISPAFIYAILSTNEKVASLPIRLIWLTASIGLIYRVCLSVDERQSIRMSIFRIIK